MTAIESRTQKLQRTTKGWEDRWQPIVVIILATVAAAVWALFIRSANVGEPFFVENWPDIEWLSPYYVGIAIQEMVVPVGLVYLFSRTPLFRRIVTNQQAEQDAYRLIAVLISIQALVFLYRFGLIRIAEAQVMTGLFMVLVAGWLGGWRAGLAVGFFTLPVIGWLDYVGWLEPQDAFELPFYVDFYVLKHMDGIVAVWMGLVAGLMGMIWGERRFRPGLVVGVALVMITVVFLATTYTSDYPPAFIERWLPNLVVMGLGTAVFSLIVRYVQDEESRRRAEVAQLELAQTNLALAQTRLALAQAELRALHAQINPHFFFNTLNTIRYFVRTDPATARDLLVKLSEIFQRALSAGEFVPLRDEINYVEAYLALEKARLDDRLQIIWTNLAKNDLDQPVPTLVLQPIVENAVIHGISTQPDGGTLHIVINRVGDDLLIQVDDDGAGFNAAAALAEPTTWEETAESIRQSIGLRNVDERLRMLYGEAYRLQIESQPGAGSRVVFKIPLSEV